jgi:hypothetical protein
MQAQVPQPRVVVLVRVGDHVHVAQTRRLENTDPATVLHDTSQLSRTLLQSCGSVTITANGNEICVGTLLIDAFLVTVHSTHTCACLHLLRSRYPVRARATAAGRVPVHRNGLRTACSLLAFCVARGPCEAAFYNSVI